jgi:hypothetical protein
MATETPKRLNLIAFSGSAGSGKDTAADILCDQYGFRRLAFASSLKDALAAIFKWPRADLDGHTAAARAWRENPDPVWSERLGIPVSPRRMMQIWGTTLGRDSFHPDIWIASLEKELMNAPHASRIVITDCRYENEATMIRRMGGRIVHIVGRHDTGASEIPLVTDPSDIIIENSGTLNDFKESVKAKFRCFEP